MDLKTLKRLHPEVNFDGDVLKKGNHIIIETIYGSFFDLDDPYLIRDRNAMSRKEAIKYGYRKIKTTPQLIIRSKFKQ